MVTARPLLLGTGVFVVSVALLTLGVQAESSDRSTDGLAVVLLAVAAFPVATMMKWPTTLIAAGVTAGAGLVYLAADYAVLPIYPALFVALFLIARQSRPKALTSGLGMGALAVGAIVLWSDDALLSLETFTDASLFLLPVVAGDNMRVRGLATAALVERAESAERTRDELAARRVQEERLRIARELHDILTHTISSLNVQVGVASHVHDDLPAPFAETLQSIRSSSKQALDELRGMLHLLRSDDGADDRPHAPVGPTPSLSELPEMVHAFETQGLEFASISLCEHDDVSPTSSLAAVQILREALTNCLRHAPAERVQLRCSVTDDDLSVWVHNRLPTHETSAQSDTTGAQVGIIGMTERARAVGGTLTAKSVDGAFVVDAVLPKQLG